MSARPDGEIVTLDHLDFTPICESRWHEPDYRPYLGPACEAMWHVIQRYPCCTRDQLLCDGCKDGILTHRTALIQCGGCGKTSRGPFSAYVVSMSRIDGAS